MTEASSSPPPRNPEEWLAEVKRFEREGELFRAYDVAMQGLDEFPSDAGLRHRAVLCLASTGGTTQAAVQFERLIGRENIDALPTPLALDIAALRARLLKDEALAASGSERHAKLAMAAEAYGAAYDAAKKSGSPEAYYPGINCATLHLLAGDVETAAALARDIVVALAALPAEKKRYYAFATEAEAYLILGEDERARAAAHEARSQNRLTYATNYRNLASTIRQLRLIVDVRGTRSDILSELTPPRVVHYVGHIISPPGGKGRFPADQEAEISAAIDAALSSVETGFGYGSLAAGSDILFAEALLRCGANLDVVLPFGHKEFVDVSVRPAGEAWVARFYACLERAATVRYATEDRYHGEDFLFGYCSELAMGLALLRGRHLASRIEQIAVWDGRSADGVAGTARDIAIWKRTGLPQTVIPLRTAPRQTITPPEPGPRDKTTPRRQTCAVLFSDVKGFSKLTDEQLPRFFGTFLAAFAHVIHRFSDKILFVNSWGDGLFLVLDDAGTAAHCALALQEEVARIDLVAAGLPNDMGLRIGGHFGPAYPVRDPVLKRRNFFGAHVSRTARIEPVTPESCVYVTENLAAVLALRNPDQFSCNYVGMTEAAKKYGKMRMFLLTRTNNE